MKKTLDITIWDSSAERLIEIDKNLTLAAREESISIKLSIMSEIPLLGRNNLLGRIPVLQIQNRQWTLRPREAFSVEECRALLRALSSNEGAENIV